MGGNSNNADVFIVKICFALLQQRDLDFINILSYDYHSSFEPQVNHHAPLRARSLFEDEFDPNEELNIVSYSTEWLK